MAGAGGTGFARSLNPWRWNWSPQALQAFEMLAMLGVVSVVPASLALSTWSEVRALKARWTIAGPPCLVVARTTPSVVGRKPAKNFQYGGVGFSRAFAEVSCQALPEDTLFARESYPVCQFNNPGAVTVTTGGRSIIFQPPVGRRATVTVRHGAATCVVGGWFNY